MSIARDEIFSRVRATLAEMFGFDLETLVDETKLVDDLDLDSIDFVDLSIRLDKELGVSVPKERYAELKTLGDVVEIIFQQTQEQ